MSTVLYISNREVLAVSGTRSRSSVTVRRICRARAPESSIVDGTVVDEEAFDRFLRKFWTEHQLPRRNVTLVLGSARAVMKLIQVPEMQHRKLMEYIPREFAGVNHRKNPVFTYLKTGKEEQMDRILVCMADRDFLKPHINRFRMAGIHLDSILSDSVAEIMALNHISYLEHRTFVAQILDGKSIQNILYVDGRYFQMSRSRVLSERGTAEFGEECARMIGGQQQFLKSQQDNQAITHVYLAGEFDERDFERCRESMLGMDSGLRVARLYAEQDWGHAVAPIGGLFRNRQQNDFLHRYLQGTEEWKHRNALKKLLLPALTAAAVLSAVIAVQAARWFYYASEVENQLSYMSSPSLTRNVAEYDRLEQEIREMEIREDAIRRTRQYLDGYPVYSSRIKAAVLDSAAGLVTAGLSAYDGMTGTVTIGVSAGQAENIHRFAVRLEEKKEWFESVSYSGFAWNERSGQWETVMDIHLALPDAAGEEAEP